MTHLHSNDPLWRALERVLRFYQLRLNEKLIHHQVAVDWTQPFKIPDIIKIAHSLGLNALIREVNNPPLDELTTPVLLLFPNADMRVLTPGTLAWNPVTGQDAALTGAIGTAAMITFEQRPATKSGFAWLSEKGHAQWFWALLRRHKRDFWDVMAATLFTNLFALVVPLFSMNVYDRVVPNHAEETLWALTIGVIVVFAFNFGFRMIRMHLLSSVATHIGARLDSELMDHVLRLPTFASKLTVGEKADLFRELQNLRDFFVSRLLPAVLDVPFFVLFVIVIYALAPALIPVVLGGVVLIFLANVACQLPINRVSERHFKETQNKNTYLIEVLTGAQEVRLFNAMGDRLLRWQRLVDKAAGSYKKGSRALGLAEDISITIINLITVFVVVVGVYQIQKNALSMGGLIASSILVGRALAPIMSLGFVVGRLRQSLDSLAAIDKIFHLPVESKWTLDHEAHPPFRGGMQLVNVTYCYPGQFRPVLNNVSITINPGEKIGLIGRTGVGKSTVTRLFEGAIEPQSGDVMVDGLFLKSVHPAEWRQNLGVVSQEPFFFSGTIRENVLFGMHEIDPVLVDQAIVASGLDALMRRAGYSMDYQIGEFGLRLSGGQRQAVALARAFLRNAPILLLDEPTNGMDHDLEQQVIYAIGNFVRGRTMILVTHRSTLLGLVDRLILIDNGGVVADGPRDEVMARLAGNKV